MDEHNTKIDGAFTANKRVIEQTGYIKGKIETMKRCLEDIKDITEHDIWFPAWAKTTEGLSNMQRLIDNGMIR